MGLPEPDAPLERTVEIARDLIRLDTTNYGAGRSNGESEAAEYVAECLRAMGLEPRLFDSEPGRTSVITHVEGSDPSKPALVLHGHLDVVPADPRNWTVDPFGGEIRDGLLWGRGAVDMKDMDAMILTALDEILGSGRQPARDIIVAFLADEEDGGALGAHYLVDHHPELFAGATEAISEVGGYSIHIADQRAYLIQTAEKALMWVKLVAHGVASHGSRLVEDSAIGRLAEAVARIVATSWPVQLTGTTSKLLDAVAQVLDIPKGDLSPDELALRLGKRAPIIRSSIRTTTNPTVLSAGYKHNVVPDMAEALIDVRPLPGQEDAVLAELQKLVGDTVDVVVVRRDVGLETPFSGPLVDSMVATLGRHDPEAVIMPYMLSGGTDNKALSKLGIKGYGFVPLQLPADLDFPSLFHGVDERVPLDALVFGKRVLADLLLSY